MSCKYDINIEDGITLTVGATILAAVDIWEVSGQSFTVSSSKVTLYDSDDNADANIVDKNCTITTGERDSVRIQYLVPGSFTSALAEGYGYYFLWTITLLDGQTRIASQPVRIVGSV